MNTQNPYKSPKKEAANDLPSPAPLFWSIGAVFGCATVGGLIGLGLGAALGAFVPGYYRSVFPNGTESGFDPVAVGIGQGLSQGIVFGGVIGLLLVAMYYWFRVRAMNKRVG